MPVVRVRCPYCGREFSVVVTCKQVKGSGAKYAYKIKTLGRLHKLILRLLFEKGDMTKREISRSLANLGVYVSGNSLSGRLSELNGMGLIAFKYTKVKLYDKKRMKFRFVKKPLWYLTEEGLEEARKLPSLDVIAKDPSF